MIEDKRSKKMGHEFDIGQTLREVVWQAVDQGRLTCGVHKCARLLEVDPFNTMLCLLPESHPGSSDVSVQIKHMLIEAFCTEYDIRLVKVDSADKLYQIVLGRDASLDNAMPSARSLALGASSADVDCLLMQYPEGKPSKEEEVIADYHKSSKFGEHSFQPCFIPLPD